MLRRHNLISCLLPQPHTWLVAHRVTHGQTTWFLQPESPAVQPLHAQHLVHRTWLKCHPYSRSLPPQQPWPQDLAAKHAAVYLRDLCLGSSVTQSPPHHPPTPSPLLTPTPATPPLPKAQGQFLALPSGAYSVAVKPVGFGAKAAGLKPCSARHQLHDLGQVCLTSTASVSPTGQHG